jgi:hypothetical protein
MKTKQYQYSLENGWKNGAPKTQDLNPQLIFAFGNRELLSKTKEFDNLKNEFKDAILVGCSTAGEIIGTEVHDNSLILTAVEFEKTKVNSVICKIESSKDSFVVGKELASKLNAPDLVHVFVLSDGLNVNGSSLVAGLSSELAKNIAVTGGLAGDGAAFENTLIVSNQVVSSNLVIAIGLYSKELSVGYGSLGGWDIFGPERIVTKSVGNVLYELDGKSALTLYKEYLGEHSKELPASGLRFPLSIRASKDDKSVVRTILGISEEDKSITFAGDIPEGAFAQLMKANFDRLIDGAINAAEATREAVNDLDADLAILISCVGRKIVLQQRIEEEVEGVEEVLGGNTVITGFYSYGEISPFTKGNNCELHNQTMTITAFKE